MSTPDIFFLSYSESNAEENWQHLIRRFPQAKRLHGITGVYRAHALLAQLAQSPFYFIVDGDNWIDDNFDFDYDFTPDQDSLYVWRARNPVNDLVYGFGGIKLYNKNLFANNKVVGTDVATTVAPKYVPVAKIASTTCFNNTPLESWRGAFREVAKLTTQLQKNPADQATALRLRDWLHLGEGRLNGNWCLLGAKQGHDFALKTLQNQQTLETINNFQWLESEFLKNQQISTDSFRAVEL